MTPSPATAPTLLVITDSRVRSLFALLLRDQGWTVESCPDARESIDQVRTRSYALILFSVDQTVTDCRDLVRYYRQACPGAALIALAVKEQMEQVLTLFPLGLSDALIQPYNPSKVIQRLREILTEHEKKQPLHDPLETDDIASPLVHEVVGGFAAYKPHHLIGKTSLFTSFLQQLWNARQNTSILLVSGPTGSEFELVVREWMHLGGDTEGYPVVVDPEEFDEDRLLTHAATNRLGVGNPLTLHLPNLHEYSQAASQSLLHFLNTIRAKNKNDRTLNIVLSTVDLDLHATESSTSFVEEVLYFVQTSVILPSLTDRSQDIPQIVRQALFELTNTHPEWSCRGIDRGVLDVLIRHPWPGNYQQLRSILYRAVQRCPGRKLTNEHMGAIEQTLPITKSLTLNHNAILVS